jgi:hypothetical protein
MNQEEFAKTTVYKTIVKSKLNDPYENSSFKELRNLSSRKKGLEMEKVFELIAKSYGFEVAKFINDGTSKSDYDRVCQKKKIEIKGSFLWEGANTFRWQQIRTNQNYDYVVFLAFYPEEVKCFYASKEDVIANLEVQNSKGEWIHNQHGGKNTNSGTFYMDGVPSDFSWVKPFTRNTVL